MNEKLEEAIEALEVLDKTITPLLRPVLAKYEDDLDDIITANYFVLKQALLKAQENEKEIAKYKQLEKDLGCPLDVVLKALKYGIYQEDGGRRKLPFIEYNSGTNKFYFGFGTYCNVEDYKKTWWLKENKEE